MTSTLLCCSPPLVTEQRQAKDRDKHKDVGMEGERDRERERETERERESERERERRDRQRQRERERDSARVGDRKKKRQRDEKRERQTERDRETDSQPERNDSELQRHACCLVSDLCIRLLAFQLHACSTHLLVFLRLHWTHLLSDYSCSTVCSMTWLAGSSQALFVQGVRDDPPHQHAGVRCFS